MKARAGQILVFVGMVVVAAVLLTAIWSSRLPVGEETTGVVEGAAPLLVVSTTDFDMGLLPNDEPSMREFKFQNEGDAPLQITKLSVSCGCIKGTKIRKKSEVLPPGGEGVVEVEFHPETISGWESTKQMHIWSNDPLHKLVTVSVSARVEQEYSIEPRHLMFGDIVKGDTPELTMHLRQMGEEPLEIKEITPSVRCESVELSFERLPESEWTQPDRAEYTVTGRLLPQVPVGRFYGQFTIVTTCKRPGVQKLSCSAQANATTFYEVNPSMLTASVGAKPGDLNVGSVTVSASVPIEVLEVSVSGDELSVSSRPGPEENTVLIEVSVLPTAKPGLIQEETTFTVKGPDRVVPHTIRTYVVVQNTG